ncbi:MAG: hypothetical protein PHV34_12195 [Verrucomicrobiae bacterium]|nr:hypothetical protein [Verrucomicrobiae bacterium]
MKNPELSLEQKPQILADAFEWNSFQTFCAACKILLKSSGRAVLSAHLDKKPQGAALPACETLACQTTSIKPGLIHYLTEAALQQQYDTAVSLIAQMQNFSVDCLIEPIHETITAWKNLLVAMEPVIGFIPQLIPMQSLVSLRVQCKMAVPGINEASLNTRIDEVHAIASVARKKIGVKEGLPLSDVIEQNLVPWTLKHAVTVNKLLQCIRNYSATARRTAL